MAANEAEKVEDVDPPPPDAAPSKRAKLMEVEAALASRQGFSSENFKIELRGLPKFCSVGEMKKLLSKRGLAFHKIKPCGKQATYMFVNFRDEEERDRAIKELDGITIRRKTIQALKAKPAKDPMLKAVGGGDDSDALPASERLLEAVCPLAKFPYEEQLCIKQKEVETLIDKVRSDVVRQFCHSRVPPSVFDSHPLLEVRPFVPSPVRHGYRGKCEFSVGRHPETGEVTVGFRLASYRRGSVAVVGVDHLPVVSDKMKSVASRFESFVRASGLPPFDSIGQTGNWKQLTVREATEGLMAWAMCNPQGLDDEDKARVRTSFKAAMTEVGVTSVHIQFMGNRIKGTEDPLVENLHGPTHIVQELNSLKFGISPQAFFQVNCACAEVLYRLAGEMAGVDADTTVMDVCCGTGTIGLCFARSCKEVLGVEIVEEAVEDANRNAKNNGVNNAVFQAGRAEFVLVDQLRRARGSKVVAVVDPPRAGLHQKALHAIRTSRVSTLVYISCDARAAAGNFLSLCRPTSNAHPGDPFVPSAVVPVDMFPHTRHFELAILFRRVSMVGLLEKRLQAVNAQGKVEEEDTKEKKEESVLGKDQ